MDTDQIAVLMTAATTYAGNLAAIFNMFITVVFGSLAFSAAMSLRNIGKLYALGKFQCSSSSVVIAAILAAFFTISFASFQQASTNLRAVLTELHCQTSGWSFFYDNAHAAFGPAPPVIYGIGLPSVGYLIGSAGTLIAFLWIANVERR